MHPGVADSSGYQEASGGEVLQVRDAGGGFQHVLERRPHAGKRQTKVGEDLFRLRLEIPGTDDSSSAVERDLARDVGGAPIGRRDDMRVAVGLRQTRRVDEPGTRLLGFNASRKPPGNEA
jgi:hypothetical protein